MNISTEFNPLSPEFQANPYPYYEMLRANAPVFFWPNWGIWFLTRYDDNVAAFKDARLAHEIERVLTREERGLQPEPEPDVAPLVSMQQSWLLFRDPPDHTRLRGLVHKAFTPRVIESLRSRTQGITDQLIDTALANGGMDLVKDFAVPLPVTVIAEMLGIPPADYPIFSGWSRDLAFTLEMTESHEVYQRGAKATVELSAYLRELINACRIQPKDDLISALVAAEAEGDKLTEDEMVGTLELLLVAGHETTVNLIGSGMLALLRHPDQWEKFKADPALVKSTTEELLRYDSPVQMTSRWILEDMEFLGQKMHRGQQVAMLIGAANHDPERFVDPGTLDITRDPNPHIAFGNGIHFCLGAPLARMESQIAFATLARRLPDLKLVTDSPRYRDTYVLRGLAELPVTI